jgi:hypothetical protein
MTTTPTVLIAGAVAALYVIDSLRQQHRSHRIAKAAIATTALLVAGTSPDAVAYFLLGTAGARQLYRRSHRTHRDPATPATTAPDAETAAKTRKLEADARTAEAKSEEAQARARTAAAKARTAEIKAAEARAIADERARVDAEIDAAYARQAAEGSDANPKTANPDTTRPVVDADGNTF